MASNRIYLDYNSTTPCDPKVVDAMIPFYTEKFGNAASRSHPFGWEAETAVSTARKQVADLIQVEEKEIIFTSGATEGVNLALKGIYEMYQRRGNHVITVKTEHSAGLDTCERLERMGADVTYLPVGSDGLVNLDELRAAITKETILVSVMWSNNEIGTIQPIADISSICKEHDLIFFSDATQAVGKIPTYPKEVGIDVMAFTAHKMYGPKGVGALYVSAKNPYIRIFSQIDGGGHERGIRSGTLNVPGIVGLGKAAELAIHQMADDAERIASLRDHLESSILSEVEEVVVNGSISSRMYNVSNLSFKHVLGERLMASFNHKIAVSSGSACTSASTDPSHVLLALGIGEDAAHNSIRFSLGRMTAKEDVNQVIEATKKGVESLRADSPVWSMYKQGIL